MILTLRLVVLLNILFRSHSNGIFQFTVAVDSGTGLIAAFNQAILAIFMTFAFIGAVHNDLNVSQIIRNLADSFPLSSQFQISRNNQLVIRVHQSRGIISVTIDAPAGKNIAFFQSLGYSFCIRRLGIGLFTAHKFGLSRWDIVAGQHIARLAPVIGNFISSCIFLNSKHEIQGIKILIIPAIPDIQITR